MSWPFVALTLENVLYAKKGATAYVTVNRPKVLNALNQRTWADLRTAFEDARDDAAVLADRQAEQQRADHQPGMVTREMREFG